MQFCAGPLAVAETGVARSKGRWRGGESPCLHGAKRRKVGDTPPTAKLYPLRRARAAPLAGLWQPLRVPRIGCFVIGHTSAQPWCGPYGMGGADAAVQSLRVRGRNRMAETSGSGRIAPEHPTRWRCAARGRR